MQILNRIISITLSLALFMLPLGVAQSAMIGNAQLIDGANGTDRAAVLKTLDRAQVREYLSGMGVDAEPTSTTSTTSPTRPSRRCGT